MENKEDVSDPAFAILYFSRRHKVRPCSIGRLLWLWATLPRERFNRAIPRLVRGLTGSPFSHVAIGDGLYVLSPMVIGDRFFPSTEYRPASGVSVALVVPLDRPMRIDPPHYKPRSIRGVLSTIVRWMTGGLTPADNCVTVAVRLLRTGGAKLPNRITSPLELWSAILRVPGVECLTPRELAQWIFES